MRRFVALLWGCIPLAAVAGCLAPSGAGAPDAIIVAGIPFRAGTRVVTWKEPGGYDAYLERRFFNGAEVLPERPARGCNVPRRYSKRSTRNLSPEMLARVEQGGYDLPALREKVDQFVLHYDVCGTSRRCFRVLHDLRGLSVHFMLDIDGTIYQTMDLKERGRHATISNDRSVGVEIAHIGAYGDLEVLHEWYVPETPLDLKIKLPESMGDGGVRTAGYVGRPRRRGLFEAVLNGNRVVQYDFTPAQYEALRRLVRTLNRALPRIRLQAPRDAAGRVLPCKLDEQAWQAFEGVLGHYHIQTNKVDPGPAFDWDHVLGGAHRTVNPQ